DYAEAAREFSTRPAPAYRRFRGVMPSWDNTARTGRRAYLALNSNPETYRAWLETAVNRTRQDTPGDEKLVFINAWNEWGEGCHLEPDRRHGLAWLEATKAALSGVAPKMSFDPEAQTHLSIYRQIDRLAQELGLEGAGPETVLSELSALVRRHNGDLAKRDDVITFLNEKLARAAQ
ncbi:MAG TPA: glycoside hydrolase family 99-like domain-containing protein, partial [Steroidobacteraceae bacterium]|nr:glycoside hydrolase family 99-like domain-containing protein [Steroidobacteraceae bacterium]